MPSAIVLEEGAKAALLKMKAGTEDEQNAAFAIGVLLEELVGRQSAVDDLTANGYVEERFDVRMWDELQDEGINAWRLKIGTISSDDAHAAWARYRIIYVFDQSRHRIHILEIIHRDRFNYEHNHPVAGRIRKACETLILPRVAAAPGARARRRSWARGRRR